jgi:hypothetical protein
MARKTEGFDAEGFKLTETSAGRLAALTGIEVGALRGMTLGEVARKHIFRIDPLLLFFRRICGRVVKTDPATGLDHPVPFARVQVEDTDCSLLGYFPHGHPWGWYFPFRCRREVIATTTTDECGNFCVMVPRWDIDWVLRFRRERRCYPVIFERPSLRDLLERLRDYADIEWPPRPIPEPDPAPFRIDRLTRGTLLRRAGDAFGAPASARVEAIAADLPLGAALADLEANHVGAAPLGHLRPPMPAEFKTLLNASTASGKRGDSVKQAQKASLALLADRASVAADLLKGIDLRRFIGPFFRCHDVFVPEWVPIFDVPDISFRVLQDTDGDGDEELIYGEGHFDVRWNAGAMPDQVIHAWPNARAGFDCGPTNIPCGNVPAIVLAGRLPVTGDPAVFDGTLGDPTAGNAQRTNRPRVGGDFGGAPITPGRAPLCRTLPLYGCNQTTAGATHYRILYRFSPDGGASFTAPTPFTGLTWPLYRLNGMGIGEWHYPSADAQGWYPIALPGGPNPWLPQNLLLDWPTTRFADGLYGLTLQVGSGGAPMAQSDEVGIVVDNSVPTGPITVEHSFAAAGPYTPISGTCPVVKRGVVPQDIYVRVRMAAAARHLRSAELWASDCGDGSFEHVSGSGGIAVGTHYRHWHQDPADNDQLLEVIYRLPAAAAQGTYGFNGYVVSRAFNPAGGDTGHLQVPPFAYDPDYIHIHPSVAFSVFNANP